MSLTNDNQPDFSLDVDYYVSSSNGKQSIEININNGTSPYDIYLTGLNNKIELLDQKSTLTIPALERGEYALVCQDEEKKLFFTTLIID